MLPLPFFFLFSLFLFFFFPASPGKMRNYTGFCYLTGSGAIPLLPPFFPPLPLSVTLITPVRLADDATTSYPKGPPPPLFPISLNMFLVKKALLRVWRSLSLILSPFPPPPPFPFQYSSEFSGSTLPPHPFFSPLFFFPPPLFLFTLLLLALWRE